MLQDKFREYIDKKPYSVAIQELFFGSKKIKHGSADRVYPFSNENIAGFLRGIDLNGAKVITVGSSGDQVLNCALKGASEITLFDANIYAKFYVALKIASIKNLTLLEFLNYFTPENIFNHKYYAKVSQDLPEEMQVFWDTIMLECDDEMKEELKRKFFFHAIYSGDMSGFNNGEMANDYYTNLEDYAKLQNALKTVFINYVTDTLDKIGDFIFKKQYDLILLSNVSDYVKRREFIQIIDMLYKRNLKKDGHMQINYFFYDEMLDDYLMSIGRHLKKDCVCITVENPMIYDLWRSGEITINDKGEVLVNKRVNVLKEHPTETCVMLEK